MMTPAPAIVFCELLPCFTQQPAEIITGSERFAQTVERFCPESSTRTIRPAPGPCPETCGRDASRLWRHRPEFSVADVKFLPSREQKALSRQAPLQATKTARFCAGYFDKTIISRGKLCLVHKTWLISTHRLKSCQQRSPVWNRSGKVWAMLSSIPRSRLCAEEIGTDRDRRRSANRRRT